jgi:hypothetical protein
MPFASGGVSWMKGDLQELVRTHLAIVTMLEGSNVLSYATRAQLETLRNDLEREIHAQFFQADEDGAAA